uniref:Uncharacterized protein n=1 Tax=Opuntia streptacantha TaxID=393608 RepID=A0A7C8YKX3_OPUST
MNLPMGSTAICMRMADMVRGWVLNMKNVLRNMRSTQEARPRTHARKVNTGMLGSSVSGTTRATSSTGHLSVSVSSILSPPPSSYPFLAVAINSINLGDGEDCCLQYVSTAYI